MSAAKQLPQPVHPEGPWTEKHLYEFIRPQGRRFRRALFWGCVMERLRETTLEHCCLANTRIAPRRVEDMLGFTVTLDCFSWKDIHLNELAFDMMLYLLTMTVGNDEKRAVLKRMIRGDHTAELEKAFENLESL